MDTHSDGKTLVVSHYLPEASNIYANKIKTGFKFCKINGVEVNIYNVNQVLQRVFEDPNNPKLTFQVTLEDKPCFDIQKLICMKHGPELSLVKFLRESMCSVLYICNNHIESDDDKGVLYCFPRPYNQNFLYNTRGAYVTLNHLAPKSLGTSAPTSSTVLCKGVLVNVTYICKNNDFLLIALPNKMANLIVAKKIINDILGIIELLYGSLKTCFTKPNNVDKLDSLFSRIFAMLSNSLDRIKMDDKYNGMHFENILPAVHSILLPPEAKIQIDDALTELEAADYREWVSI